VDNLWIIGSYPVNTPHTLRLERSGWRSSHLSTARASLALRAHTSYHTPLSSTCSHSVCPRKLRGASWLPRYIFKV